MFLSFIRPAEPARIFGPGLNKKKKNKGREKCYSIWRAETGQAGRKEIQMENRENMENMEDRESRDVIGRKKGPVLASVILAVVLIIFTRGKGFNFGKGEENQGPENAPAQVLEKGEEKAVTLADVLADPDAFRETLPERVEVLADGEHVSVNGWTCRDGEELKDFLTAFGGLGTRFELRTGGEETDAARWVREAFDLADIPYTEEPES
jgi:hypothetical protein